MKPGLAPLALVVASGLVGCADSAGPDGRVGRLAIHPTFAAAAGIVEIARTRIQLADAQGDGALDTVVVVPPGADSVTLVAQVPLSSPNQSFTLTVAFITPNGDTAFYGGPITVQLGAGAGPPVPVTLPTIYVGVGANATGVRITTPGAFLQANDSVMLAAEAFDSTGQVIPNTPIAWSSLDPSLATVPDPAVGTVVSTTAVGQARIVAALLTGPADTLVAEVGAEAGTGTVLVLSNYAPDNATVRDSFPPNMPGFTFDTMDVSIQTPTLAFLRQYRVILLFENTTFGNSPNVGDTVAAYVQAGGNLVIGTFYWQNRSDNTQLTGSGWGELETLDPFFGPYGSEYRADSLDPGSIVAHPMTAGLDSLYVDSYHGGVVAKPGTTVLARWSDACIGCEPDTQTPLLGYRIEANGQRIVGVSTFPPYPAYRSNIYRGNFYRLWANVLGWAILGGPGSAGARPLPAGALRAHPVAASTEPARVRLRGGSARR